MLRGRGRIRGTAKPGHWANFGPRRPRKTVAFLVDAGKAVEPFVPPGDPAAFESALRERGVEVTDSGTAPVHAAQWRQGGWCGGRGPRRRPYLDGERMRAQARSVWVRLRFAQPRPGRAADHEPVGGSWQDLAVLSHLVMPRVVAGDTPSAKR